MRKKYFRLLMSLFKNWKGKVDFYYKYNMRVVKTKSVTCIIVNLWKFKKITVYYFYMPEKLYLNYDNLEVIYFKTHWDVFNYIKKEISRIEDEDIYRKYRIAKYEHSNADRES